MTTAHAPRVFTPTTFAAALQEARSALPALGDREVAVLSTMLGKLETLVVQEQARRSVQRMWLSMPAPTPQPMPRDPALLATLDELRQANGLPAGAEDTQELAPVALTRTGLIPGDRPGEGAAQDDQPGLVTDNPTAAEPVEEYRPDAVHSAEPAAVDAAPVPDPAPVETTTDGGDTDDRPAQA
ncbi:hypothetical protein [Amycolatopsis thermophila]|uniref:Uncharacterized protein n=1 Tax=Amycolatopsis thermophila TaxID=206084 RepID=A0ABU0ENP6_9PSEU|nr:hypothetical protein [Amycolatopsis thermophila]MDQ0376630.1 hypothetical protein [Amycolatopsis thermophila]